MKTIVGFGALNLDLIFEVEDLKSISSKGPPLDPGEEGLGTKDLVADAMYMATAKSYYDRIAQCTVAMIVNDMITLGALPLSVAMHLAVGVSSWFSDENRCDDLIDG